MTVAAVAAILLAATPLDVAVDVTPRSVPFGDAVEARATVVVDTRRRDPDDVVVRISGGALDKLDEQREWSRFGSSAILRIRLRLACRSARCVPTARARVVRLPPLVVDGRSVPWPSVNVLPRVPASAVETEPTPFATDLTPPAPTYRLDPDRAVPALLALALLLAAAAGALLAVEARAAQGRPQRFAGTALERALARLRASLGASPGERRRAAGAVARLVEPAHPSLGQTAGELAWAEAQPAPEALEALAARVEREASAG